MKIEKQSIQEPECPNASFYFRCIWFKPGTIAVRAGKNAKLTVNSNGSGVTVYCSWTSSWAGQQLKEAVSLFKGGFPLFNGSRSAGGSLWISVSPLAPCTKFSCMRSSKGCSAEYADVSITDDSCVQIMTELKEDNNVRAWSELKKVHQWRCSCRDLGGFLFY